MKNFNRMIAFLLAAAMTMGMSLTAMAEETINEAPEAEETVNELPEGTAGNGKTITIKSPDKVNEDDSYIYTVYKVFDAINSESSNAISYKLIDGAEKAPDGFTVDDAGNVYLGEGEMRDWTEGSTAGDGEILITLEGKKKYLKPKSGELSTSEIDAIREYSGKKVIGKVTIKGSGTRTVEVPDYGYFFITTTTGSLVSIDSTNPNAEVTDKNTITTVVKSAGTEYSKDALKAIAAVGTSQDFTAQITIGKGAHKVIFTDTMTDMVYDGNVTLKVGDDQVEESAYTVDGKKGDSVFTITFADSYTAGLQEGTVITLNYSGTITSDALSLNPATNTATVTFGEGNTSTSAEIKVYNAKFTITKTDGKGDPLKGAGFVLARDAEIEDTSENAEEGAKTTQRQYYRIVTTETGEGEDAAVTSGIEWVTDINEATEYTSDDKGDVTPFTGLGEGTYIRIEKTVPAGYNKAADAEFTIIEGDYTDEHKAYEAENLERTEDVVNNAGTVLPHTGGMGTTLFNIIGTILVVGAGVMLVARRRMEII